MIKSMKQM